VRLLLSEGQQSDHKGAATLLPNLPLSRAMPDDKGYDSDAYRATLMERGITPCIPPRAKRKRPATCCKTLYKQHHKMENLFAIPPGRLLHNRLPGSDIKDWRLIAMLFDRFAHAFLSAIQIAAIVIFWINQCVLTPGCVDAQIYPKSGSHFSNCAPGGGLPSLSA